VREREPLARDPHRSRFVVHTHVDHAVGGLHVHRAHDVGLDPAQATALDHGRAAHADAGAFDRHDQVAAAQQRGIAGEAAPGHDAHQRHLARQRGQARKGRAVEAGDAVPVDVARPPAAAFGEQHQRQALARASSSSRSLLAWFHTPCVPASTV
jgi:hypothetical protein